MVCRYADAEATMGNSRRVGDVGLDEAGNIPSPMTVELSFFLSPAISFLPPRRIFSRLNLPMRNPSRSASDRSLSQLLV